MHQMIEKKKPVQKKKVDRPMGVAPEFIADLVLKKMVSLRIFIKLMH